METLEGKVREVKRVFGIHVFLARFVFPLPPPGRSHGMPLTPAFCSLPSSSLLAAAPLTSSKTLLTFSESSRKQESFGFDLPTIVKTK